MMKNSFLFISFLMLVSCNNSSKTFEDLFTDKFTGINTVSYTDVTYAGVKDTVLVTTYSGRVAFRYKNNSEEKVLAQLNDEIYVVKYNPVEKHVALSTMELGVVVIDATNAKELYKLPLQNTWSLSMGYSEDFNYLFANDQKGNRFLWSVKDNYESKTLPENLPKGFIVGMDNNIIKIKGTGKIIYWDIINNSLVKEIPVFEGSFEDMDEKGNILTINRDTFTLFNTKKDSVEYSHQHPGWLRPKEDFNEKDFHEFKEAGIVEENGYYDIPGFHLPLTCARFGKKNIYTSGADRSIRIWNKDKGELIDALTGHKATVNQVDVCGDKTQLVSVDLKGGIRFWDIQ